VEQVGKLQLGREARRSGDRQGLSSFSVSQLGAFCSVWRWKGRVSGLAFLE